MADVAAYQHGLRMVAVGTSGTLAVDGLAVLGDAHGHLGRWDEALSRGAEAQTVAVETANPWDMHIANYDLARTLLVRGDAASALPLITANIEFKGERSGFPMVVKWHSALLGQAYLQFGQYEQAIQSLDCAIAECTEMQLVWASTLARLAKAETELAAGMTGATATAEETLRFARRHGYKAFEASACRVLALCLRTLDPSAARRYLSTARAIAVKRGMMPELNAIETAQVLLN